MVRIVNPSLRTLLLLGGALVTPLAVTWAYGEIRGPTRIFLGPGTYWVGWLLVGVLLAALLGIVLLIVGAALALFRRNVG